MFFLVKMRMILQNGTQFRHTTTYNSLGLGFPAPQPVIHLMFYRFLSTVYKEYKLTSPFKRAIHLYKIQLLLIICDSGVLAMTEEGGELWRYESPDEISHCSTVDNEEICLEFLDDDPVKLWLFSGERHF